MSQYREEGRLLLARWLFILSLGAAVAAPLFALVIPFRPSNEMACTWFQRSGSLMVMLSLLAELSAVRIFNLLNPSGFVSVGFKEFENKYKNLPVKYSVLCLIAIGTGTVIWGYGDLLLF